MIFLNSLCNFIPNSDIPYQAVAGWKNKFQGDKTGGLNTRDVKGKRKVQHRLNAVFSEIKRINSLSVEIAVRSESVFGEELLRLCVIN